MTEQDDRTFLVVMNLEDQYSIWPASDPLPEGWRAEGFQGDQAACLEHIDDVWTDMRPRSLREVMREWERSGEIAETIAMPEPDLVARLCEGSHAVEVVLRPEPTLARLREALDDGYVHLLFPQTKGGTELGITLDPHATSLATADLEAGTGQVTLTGRLTLDLQPLRCVAQIGLSDLHGTASLQLA